jgi:hypothetical protein
MSETAWLDDFEDGSAEDPTTSEPQPAVENRHLKKLETENQRLRERVCIAEISDEYGPEVAGFIKDVYQGVVPPDSWWHYADLVSERLKGRTP